MSIAEADQGGFVPTQPLPGVAPEPLRRLELDFPGFDLREAHESRILGFRNP